MESDQGKFYAILISLLFPFCGIFSSLLVGFLKDGISMKHRCILITTFTGAFMLFLVAMHFLLSVSSLPIAIIFVCLCGCTILGPYSLLCGAFSVDIGGKYRSSTVTGIVDAFGFISETLVIGTCYYWGSSSGQSFLVLVILSAAAVVTSLILWRVDFVKRKKCKSVHLQYNSHDHLFILDTQYMSVQNNIS